MKKVFLTAGLILALTATSFAKSSETSIDAKLVAGKESSERITEDDPTYPCVFIVSVTNRRGEVTSTIPYSGLSNNADDCCSWADSTVAIKNRELANSSTGATASHNL